MAKTSKLLITQVRGWAGKSEAHRRVLRALGLRRTGQITEKPDTPAIRGMVRKVQHLVRVEEK